MSKKESKAKISKIIKNHKELDLDYIELLVATHNIDPDTKMSLSEIRELIRESNKKEV